MNWACSLVMAAFPSLPGCPLAVTQGPFHTAAHAENQWDVTHCGIIGQRASRGKLCIPSSRLLTNAISWLPRPRNKCRQSERENWEFLVRSVILPALPRKPIMWVVAFVLEVIAYCVFFFLCPCVCVCQCSLNGKRALPLLTSLIESLQICREVGHKTSLIPNTPTKEMQLKAFMKLRLVELEIVVGPQFVRTRSRNVTALVKVLRKQSLDFPGTSGL